MPEKKKISKSERERLAAVKKYAAQEQAVLDSLNDKSAQYYSLNGVTVNFHETGMFENEYLEGYILFPDPIARTQQIDMQSDLIRMVNGGQFSLRHLVQYVLQKMPEDYRALLYWQSDVLVKQIKKIGAWNEADDVQWSEQRKALKEIVHAARHYRMHMARDLVQYTVHEFPPKYRLVLFENTGTITKRIDKTEDDDYGIIFSDDKEKFELRKFSDARKYCW